MKQKIRFFIATLLFPLVMKAAGQCVNIYYDRGPDDYWIGHANATYMQNLLGHFPHLQQIVNPIEIYKKGDIEKCKANIYIGTHFQAQIPNDFYQDYINAKTNVAWLGYNVWRNPDVLRLFNYSYDHLTTLNTTLLDETAKPTFFKWIYYKGERFKKFGEWSVTTPRTFLAPFEMVAVKPLNFISTKTQILSTAAHNGTGELLPYILRNNNHFYIADSVFSFMHESDRYLVFADVLFDILNEQPRHKKKMALMRIEDVHPMFDQDILYKITDTLSRLNVPINISIIPIYYDPLKYDDRPLNESYMPASRRRIFVDWIREVQRLNGRFIWHGVTHQYSKMKNPHTGASGDDFEFWNARQNRPIAEDSPKWVLDRLYIGYKELVRVNVKPFIWLTPHYQASALDNILFSHVMPWSIGRVIYQNVEIQNPISNHNTEHWFMDANPEKQKKRLSDLGALKVRTTSPWSGQLFPYEIYGDVYGQRLLPENLGNVQPEGNDQVVYPRTADEIIADARRNLVLRDVWASYFYHPFLFNVPNGEHGRRMRSKNTRELERVVTELKNMGYEFIDIEAFARQNVDVLRPEPKVNWGKIIRK